MPTEYWYLEVNGKKIGPFTLEQIQGFLSDGEIKPYHQVTSEKLAGRWISVEELLHTDAPPPPPPSESTAVGMPVLESTPVLEATPVLDISPALEAAPVSESAPSLEIPIGGQGNFQPPPRPEIHTEPTDEDKPDPTLSLFNALQGLREKRNASIQPPAVKSRSNDPLLKFPNVKVPELSEITGSFKYVRSWFPAEFTTRMILVAIFAGIILGSLTWGFVKMMRTKAPAPGGKLTEISHHHDRLMERPATPPLPTVHAAPPVFTRPTETRRYTPPPPPPMRVQPITRPMNERPTRPMFEPTTPPPAYDAPNDGAQQQDAAPPGTNSRPAPQFFQQQNGQPQDQNDSAQQPPPQQQQPPVQQQQPDQQNGGQLDPYATPINAPANQDQNGNVGVPPPPPQTPQDAPGQDNFAQPPTQ